MNILKFASISSLVFLPVFISVTVEAKIYKCSSDQGEVYYNDKPCPVEDKEDVIKNEKDVLNGYAPDFFDKKEGNQKSLPVKTGQINEAVSSVRKKPRKVPKRSVSGSTAGSLGQKDPAEVGHSNNAMKVTPPIAIESNTTGKLTLKDKKRILGVHYTPE